MTAALRIDARRPRWKPLPQPHALERAYYARLMAVVNRTFGLLRKKLAAHLPADARRQDAAEDEPPDNFKAVTFTIEEVEFELAESFPATSVRKAAESTAKEIDAAHLRATRRQFSEATGIDILKEAPKLRPTVEEFTKENVALIKSIPKEAMEGLRHALVAAGLEKGVRPERLAKMLEERYGVAQRRAQLIATDQVGKLMSSLTEERHRELGITKYRWRTSRDNRVRRLHVRREGVVFEYDNPPPDGHAGAAIRCRCWCEPIVPEPLVEELKEKAEPKKKAAAPQSQTTPTRQPAGRTRPKKPTAKPARRPPKQPPPAKRAPAKAATPKPPVAPIARPVALRRPTTAPRQPAEALAAQKAKALPNGAVRGADAAAVMREFPETRALGDLLRVDDFSHPIVRKEVGDLARLPPSLLSRLPEAMADLHISTKPITEIGRSGYLAQFAGQKARGWKQGSTLQQVGGAYVPATKEVLVAVLKTPKTDDSVVLHEVAHALDYNLRQSRTSASKSFVAAWEDFKDGDYANSKHPYFTQKVPAGPEETFAEAFATYFKWGRAVAVKDFGPKVVAALEAEYGPTVFAPKEDA